MSMDEGLQILPPIFTIGYGRRKLEVFIALLQKYNIHYLVDVRTYPSSKFNLDFTKGQLERSLPHGNVKYIFMGDILGGRPEGPQFYTPEGKVDYSKVRASEPFRRGIDRLLTARSRHFRCVLMCSEERPEHCHRVKLIGEALNEMGVEIWHIDGSGTLRSHSDIMRVVRYNLPTQQSLFENPSTDTLTSRKRYRIASEKE